MVEREVTIRNRAGLHTRPAATLVKTAARFKSELTIMKDGMDINGKSIIGVMTLAAECGSKLLLQFDGADEQEALATVTELFERGFDEELGVL
ncbi:MAG: HPr family phosphocarrier protein [Ignavibacteriae bacterium]|nr:HPr family phosphocarrier protein [Ignavibacteriota bacterium]